MLNLIRPIIQPFLRARLANFKSALQTPQQTQQQLLKKIIADLAETDYGRALKINASDDYADFAMKMPVATFDELNQWIWRQQQTENHILVNEPVLFYEKTSGSSAAAKLIPYTKSLKDSFNRMFLIWLGDLLEKLPQLRTGKTFISISPAFNQQQTTEQGKRIGLADDSEYLSYGARVLLKPFLVLPPAIKHLKNPTSFKHALALLLLAKDQLEVISIWNPSLFEIILAYIQANAEALIRDLQRGSATIETSQFTFKIARAERLSLLKEKPIAWQRLWPELRLISCWTSAQAKPAAERLAAKFPGVFLQGKGLLATEAPMTFPLVEAHGFVPMLTEVFFEFLDGEEKIKLLQELESGREYEIILTQQGGLYRYRIGDRVRVTGFYQATPCLEFIGRTAEVCDLVGEKLNARFVEECLLRLSGPSEFQMLLPVMSEKPYYSLVVDKLSTDSASLAAELENLLCEAYHYGKARMLDQLEAVRIYESKNARAIYFDYFVSRGLKLGDIKHRYLITNLKDAMKLLAQLAEEG